MSYTNYGKRRDLSVIWEFSKYHRQERTGSQGPQEQQVIGE